MNRRDATRCLSWIGAAAVAAPIGWPAAAGALDEEFDSRCVVIHDARYPDAHRFAESVQGRRIMRLATTGDPVTLWARECRLRLTGQRWRMIGMTSYCEFTLLRACARESGGMMLYEGLHDFRRSGTVRHVLRAGAAAESLARVMQRDDWAASLARALTSTRLAGLHVSGDPFYVEGGRVAHGDPGTLVSWIIARGA